MPTRREGFNKSETFVDVIKVWPLPQLVRRYADVADIAVLGLVPPHVDVLPLQLEPDVGDQQLVLLVDGADLLQVEPQLEQQARLPDGKI